MPEEVGGIGLPTVIALAIGIWFSAANVATAGYSFLTAANANLLLAHGSPEQIERWVPPDDRGPVLRHHVSQRTAGRARRCRTSPPKPSRKTTARTASAATRCGSPAVTMI